MPLPGEIIYQAGHINFDYDYWENTMAKLALPEEPDNVGIKEQYIMTKKAYDRYQALIKNERVKDAEVAAIKQEMEELKASRVMYKEVTDREVYVADSMWHPHSNYGRTPPTTRIEVSPKEEIAMFIDAKREAETALAKEKKLNETLYAKYGDLKHSLRQMSKREMWKYVQEEL